MHEAQARFTAAAGLEGFGHHGAEALALLALMQPRSMGKPQAEVHSTLEKAWA